MIRNAFVQDPNGEIEAGYRSAETVEKSMVWIAMVDRLRL